MVREDIGYKPEWNDRIQGYARGFLSKNLWRVESLHSLDDLMQDAYLIFLRVKQAYPRVIDPPHFMRLFQVALLNELHDKARHKQKRGQTFVDSELDVSEDYADRIGEYSNDGHLQVILNELPSEVRAALSVFSDPDKLKELRQKPTRTKMQKAMGLPALRENLSMKLCRIAGIPKMDVIRVLKEACSG